MNIKILVAAHKPYWMPEEEIYLPIQVGAIDKASIDSRWARDDTGDNISQKNITFCELTGVYWAWKNLDAEVYGLCHYRRYFSGKGIWKGKKELLLSRKEIESLLSDHDIILPKKRHYWIETRGSQYAHAHHAEDLACMEAVLAERCPDYLPAWKHMLDTRSGHICNMFVMRKGHFDAYCVWLFELLFEAEKRLDISMYTVNDRRVFGFLGERLLDVWVEKNGLRAIEMPIIHLESQHWLLKGGRFLRRKIQGHQ